MPVWDVEITRKITLKTTVRIEAPDRERAECSALEFSGENLPDDEMDVEEENCEAVVKGGSDDQDGEPDYGWEDPKG